MSNMKFLGIGLGSIGQRHFRNLHALSAGELLAFRQRGGKPRDIDERLFKSFSSLDEALAQKPDAVLVTNPTHLHVQTALRAAERGCHLFIEKPLSHNLEGLDELLKTIDERGLVTLMGCNLRFHPNTQEMKQLVDEKGLGKISSVRVVCSSYLPDWHPWEDYRQSYAARKSMGGGAILTCIHELDYLCWLFGDVESVKCRASNSALGLEVEDTADIKIRFRNGVLADIHLSFGESGYNRYCEILGNSGTRKWEFKPGQIYDQTYVEEMKHFIKCIRGEENSINDVHEGRRVLEIALLAKRSAEEGKLLKR